MAETHHDLATGLEQSVMKGKALAASMGLESIGKPGEPKNWNRELVAGYRSGDAFVRQDECPTGGVTGSFSGNYTGEFPPVSPRRYPEKEPSTVKSR